MRTIVNDNRPVNLDISTIHLPITAIVSILTRISGVALFVAAALMLYLLDMSLAGEAGFNDAKQLMTSPLAKVVLWLILVAVIYHSLSGIKHVIGDFGVGETLEGGVFGSKLVIALAVVISLLAGVWIW